MIATVSKWGNSLAIRIPQNLAKEIQVVEGSEVETQVIEEVQAKIEPLIL